MHLRKDAIQRYTKRTGKNSDASDLYPEGAPFESRDLSLANIYCRSTIPSLVEIGQVVWVLLHADQRTDIKLTGGFKISQRTEVKNGVNYRLPGRDVCSWYKRAARTLH
jgi:hypothetical protein